MTTPTKEYYEAKADLCRKVAIKQILEGKSEQGTENLIRMVLAMENARAVDNG